MQRCCSFVQASCSCQALKVEAGYAAVVMLLGFEVENCESSKKVRQPVLMQNKGAKLTTASMHFLGARSAELVGIVPRIDLVHALPAALRPKQQQQRGQKRVRTRQEQQAADRTRLHSIAGDTSSLIHS